MATTCCNLVKKGGGSGHVAHKYHNILPKTHAEPPCRRFINLSEYKIMQKQLMQVSPMGIERHNKLRKIHDTFQQ